MTITLRLEKDEPLTFDEVDGNFTDLDMTKADVGHTHVPTEIVGSTAAGRAMLTAADATAQTALLDAATTSLKGLMSSSDKTKLDAITGTNTGDETASGVLTKIKTVDGDGSGLDADKLDGLEATAFALASHTQAASTISDSTSAGRALLTAATTETQRRALGVYTYATRSDLVSAVGAGLVGTHKTIVHADGLAYQWYALSTAIDDLPGLVPAGDVYVDHWGAKADNSTNSTTAFTRAAAFGGEIHGLPGTYLVDIGQIVCTKQVNWKFDPATVIKARSAPSALGLLFDFTSAATGSSLEGGTIDGDRDTLKSGFSNPDWLWTGLRALNVDYFTLKNVTFKNWVAMGWWVQGDYMLCENVWVYDSSKMSQIKKCEFGTFRNIWGVNIGNDAIDVYQHANEWRENKNCVFDGVYGYNFQPDATGREPKPSFIVFETSKYISLKNVFIDGYSGVSASGREAGIVADTVEMLFIDSAFVSGYRNGLILNSCTGKCSNSLFDPRYPASNGSDAVQVTNCGIIESGNGVLSYESRLIRSTFNYTFENVTATRSQNGWNIRGNVYLLNCQGIGNVGDGIQVTSTTQNQFFVEPAQLSRGVVIHGGRFTENGSRGISLETCDDTIVRGVDCRNNGQNSSLGGNSRANISIATDTTNATIEQCRLGDNQNWTRTAAGSFNPGAVNASKQIQVAVTNPQMLAIGQNVTLKNAVSSADQIGKIVEINYWRDEVTIQTATSVTFTETGNLTSLTGTLSSSGTTVTGTGTAFTTEILGPVYIKANGEYRQVRRVDSNTSLQIESAFSSNLSGASAQKLTVDIVAIPSAQYAFRSPNTTETILYRNNDEVGCVVSPYSLDAYTFAAPGTRLTLKGTTSLSTSNALTALLTGIPAGWQSIAASDNITTAITGTDGLPKLTVRDGSGEIFVFGTHTALTVNDKVRASSYGCQRVSGNMGLYINITGGADNIASGGAVTWAWMIEKCPVPAIASV